MILTGGYTTPSLVTEYSGLDSEPIDVVTRYTFSSAEVQIKTNQRAAIAYQWKMASCMWLILFKRLSGGIAISPKISQFTANYFKVLMVVGGVDADEALAGSELLDYTNAGAGAGSELLDYTDAGATWSPAAPLPAPMWGARGVLLGGRFLLVGGYAASYQDSILAWDSLSQVFLSHQFSFSLCS